MAIYEDMVRRVNEAARAVGTECLGVTKAFISDVARHLGYDVKDFQAWVMKAHRWGDVTLTRCDLVEAYPADKVDASETQDGISVWHFVTVVHQ